MKTFGQRLRKRIDEMGLNPPAVARRLGIENRRLNHYLNDKREPDLGLLQRICGVLEATPDQLLGLASMSAEDHMGTAPDLPAPAPPEYVAIRHMQIRAGMGDPEDADEDGEMAYAYFPADLVRHVLRAVPDDLRLMEVEGPSMYPILHDADQVIVNISKRNPSQPAIFVLWDGFGRVAKWLERVHNSDPPRLRISSENPRFQPYEALAEEVNIIGRIVWFARRI